MGKIVSCNHFTVFGNMYLKVQFDVLQTHVIYLPYPTSTICGWKPTGISQGFPTLNILFTYLTKAED